MPQIAITPRDIKKYLTIFILIQLREIRTPTLSLEHATLRGYVGLVSLVRRDGDVIDKEGRMGLTRDAEEAGGAVPLRRQVFGGDHPVGGLFFLARPDFA